MGRVVIDIRDERGRFVTRLHPSQHEHRLWCLAAEAKDMTLQEFIRWALRDYLNQFEPHEDQ